MIDKITKLYERVGTIGNRLGSPKYSYNVSIITHTDDIIPDEIVTPLPIIKLEDLSYKDYQLLLDININIIKSKIRGYKFSGVPNTVGYDILKQGEWIINEKRGYRALLISQKTATIEGVLIAPTEVK